MHFSEESMFSHVGPGHMHVMQFLCRVWTTGCQGGGVSAARHGQEKEKHEAASEGFVAGCC
jgi:hypothetical protein